MDMDFMNCICWVDPVASLFCIAWRKAGFEMMIEVTDASFARSQSYGFDGGVVFSCSSSIELRLLS